MALLRRTIPVKPTHVEPEQKAMSAFIRNFDYPGLVSQIESAESNKAVKLNQSRLQGEWKKDAIHLLAQLKPDILQSILDNTLPQRANRGSSTRIREVATNRTTTDKTLDPVIYINYLADKYGQGMTFKQFRLFLDALGCAAGGYLDDPDRFIVGNISLRVALTRPSTTSGISGTMLSRTSLTISKTKKARTRGMIAHHSLG